MMEGGMRVRAMLEVGERRKGVGGEENKVEKRKCC
jgi:hypothetical protein